MVSPKVLHHGGIMANYRCNAACRHCFYACSPQRSGGYVDAAGAAKICETLAEGSCGSVHIGGGEPFLSVDGLLQLVGALRRSGIALDYIETNGFWAQEEGAVLRVLDKLMAAGADTLLISVDPFHAEYVPIERPLLLEKLCRRAGMGSFVWKSEFLPAMSRLDRSSTHSRAELERLIAPDYILETARAYGLSCGGRAVNIELEYQQKHPADALADARPCANLLSTGHFHVDLYCRFIPPDCTGIVIPLEKVVRGFDAGEYPVFDALYSGGVAALLKFARERGIVPDPNGYTSRCALCFFLRMALAETGEFAELDRAHYTAAMMYYN